MCARSMASAGGVDAQLVQVLAQTPFAEIGGHPTPFSTTVRSKLACTSTFVLLPGQAATGQTWVWDPPLQPGGRCAQWLALKTVLTARQAAKNGWGVSWYLSINTLPEQLRLAAQGTAHVNPLPPSFLPFLNPRNPLLFLLLEQTHSNNAAASD